MCKLTPQLQGCGIVSKQVLIRRTNTNFRKRVIEIFLITDAHSICVTEPRIPIPTSSELMVPRTVPTSSVSAMVSGRLRKDMRLRILSQQAPCAIFIMRATKVSCSTWVAMSGGTEFVSLVFEWEATFGLVFIK